MACSPLHYADVIAVNAFGDEAILQNANTTSCACHDVEFCS